MTDAPTDRKTLETYAADRAKLNALKVPLTAGFASTVENDYRTNQKVEYLLGMVGHLLRRIDELEKAAGKR